MSLSCARGIVRAALALALALALGPETAVRADAEGAVQPTGAVAPASADRWAGRIALAADRSHGLPVGVDIVVHLQQHEIVW